jgi:hypothetical protein
VPLWITKRSKPHTIDIAEAAARMTQCAASLRLTVSKARRASTYAQTFGDRVEAQIAHEQRGAP